MVYIFPLLRIPTVTDRSDLLQVAIDEWMHPTPAKCMRQFCDEPDVSAQIISQTTYDEDGNET